MALSLPSENPNSPDGAKGLVRDPNFLDWGILIPEMCFILGLKTWESLQENLPS